MREQPLSIAMITISLLPNLASLTLWSLQTWDSEYLRTLGVSLRALAEMGKLGEVSFPSLRDVTIGNAGLHFAQAVDTFNLMAIFASLPTVSRLVGYGVRQKTAVVINSLRDTCRYLSPTSGLWSSMLRGSASAIYCHASMCLAG